jgi:hypothetical protein
MAYWKSAGVSYLQYLNIATSALRQSSKVRPARSEARRRRYRRPRIGRATCVHADAPPRIYTNRGVSIRAHCCVRNADSPIVLAPLRIACLFALGRCSSLLAVSRRTSRSTRSRRMCTSRSRCGPLARQERRVRRGTREERECSPKCDAECAVRFVLPRSSEARICLMLMHCLDAHLPLLAFLVRSVLHRLADDGRAGLREPDRSPLPGGRAGEV